MATTKTTQTKSHAARAKKKGIRRSVGQYLIDRLYDLGVHHIFGIPGDYVLQFYSMLENSPIEVIGTTREDCAGFAADAYARVKGLGAVCVTYCVGGLNLCNAVAGAYAEKSPVVVISGAPGIGERATNPLLHHRVRDFSTQLDVFERLTVATAELDDPALAYREIDRVLEAAVRFKRPVYIEIPRDRVAECPPVEHRARSFTPKSDKQALSEALDEATEMINACKRPVIIAGVEIHRFALQKELLKLAEETEIPMTATLLGKSVVSEVHPLYLGIYEGAMGSEEVRQFVEDSDCVILLGAFMTDINLGIYTANLDPAKCIYATSEQLRISHHHFHDVLLSDFVKGLARAKLKAPQRTPPPRNGRDGAPFELQPEKPVAIQRLFEHLGTFLTENMVVIADIGDSLFGAIDLVIHRQTEFLSPAYYTSMGFAVPAALGAKCANPQLRPIVIVGDGAFQMTGMELSTILRHRFNPIILVLNNEGYGTERWLQAGAFNDIHDWKYHRIPEVLGGGWGFEVHTEGELDQALKAALANQDSFSLLNIHLSLKDRSPALERLARRLARKV